MSPLVTTYAVGLTAAVWSERPARYLTRVVGVIAIGWEVVLLAFVFVIRP